MNPEGEKGKAAVGRTCRKGFKPRVKEWVMEYYEPAGVAVYRTPKLKFKSHGRG